jgi:dTDP-4-amino-4,6-dideoxygalactose transaminase
MKINQVDLNRSYLNHKPTIDNAIQNCINDSAFINGVYVKQFEKAWAKYTSSESCAGVGSGTDALHLSLLALNIGPGDEVILPSLTFFATAEAISQVGATPIFVDVTNEYLLDVSTLKYHITENTKAIITVDLYGQTPDNKEISNLCKLYDLFFIQDCAHSAGTRYNNESVSKYADLACWSFYPGKNLDCFGDGGAVTGSDKLVNKVQYLKDHARTEKYIHTGIGWNSRLDGIQAAILLEKLKWLDEDNTTRRNTASIYNYELRNLPISLPSENTHSRHVYHQYVILTDERDRLLKYMQSKDITMGIHYPVPCHKQPVYNSVQTLYRTERITETCISIPIHPNLSRDEVYKIVTELKNYFN